MSSSNACDDGNNDNSPLPPPPSTSPTLPPLPQVTPRKCNDDFCIPGFSSSQSLPYGQGVDDYYNHVINTLIWLQQVTATGTAWWGKELTAEELIAFIISNETGGSEIYAIVHEIMAAKYNLYCGAGPWSASCIQGFWSYFSGTINLYGSSGLQQSLFNLPNEFNLTDLLNLAQNITGRSQLGTLQADWDWGNLSASANPMAFEALVGQIGNLSVQYEPTKNKNGNVISFFFIITPSQKEAICSIQNVNCSNGLVNAP